MVIQSTALGRFAVQEFRSLEEPLKNTYQTERHNLYTLTFKQKLEKTKRSASLYSCLSKCIITFKECHTATSKIAQYTYFHFSNQIFFCAF